MERMMGAGINLPLSLPIVRRLANDGANIDVGGGWWFPGASLDMDFAGNQIYGGASFASALAITRASTGYAEKLDGTWVQFASGELRRTDKGLLIEEARTNSIRNNSMQGAAAGTPGTLPTNTFGGTLAGLTRTLGTPTTENGVDVLDYRFVGTATGSIDIQFESSSVITAAAAQAWASSLFLKLSSGTLANVTSIQLLIAEWDSSGSVFKAATTTALSNPGSSLARQSTTRTLTDVTTGRVTTALRINVSGAVDFTIRIGWPQLEQGAFATSPIRTTSAAATRAADIVTVNSPTNYVSLAQGSSFVEWDEAFVAASGNSRRLFGMRVDSSNYIASDMGSTGFHSFGVLNAGVSQLTGFITSNPVALGQKYKSAARWNTNDFAFKKTASLGADPANDTLGTPPSGVFVLGIGNGNNTVLLNAYIRRIAFFQSPQSDAALSAMVA